MTEATETKRYVPKVSRIEKVRLQLGIQDVNMYKIQRNSKDKLTPEEIKVKKEYTKQVRMAPLERQQQKLQDMIDNGTFPLPTHCCPHCLCNEERSMCIIVKDTLEATSTPLIKVKEFIQYRELAIKHNLDKYSEGELKIILPTLLYNDTTSPSE
jgi:hypothetical protein